MIYERFAEEIFNSPVYADLRRYTQQCLARADMIICVSQATKMDLEKYILVDPMKIRINTQCFKPGFSEN